MVSRLVNADKQSVDDLKLRLDESPISKFQLLAIAVCFVIFILDGYDALVIAFAGPAISDDWNLTGAELGVLFSSSLIGMAFGAIGLAPLADRYGRRPIILVSLSIVSVGMLLSAYTTYHLQLAALRLLTGIGVGAALASVNIIVAEYSPSRSRSLAIGVLQTAYPLGAMLGGAVAVVLVAVSGWQAIFLVGGFGSALMIPIAMLVLPESIDFLISKRPRNALNDINRQLARMGQPRIARLPDDATAKQSIGIRALLGPTLRRTTLLLWAAFFMVMFCLYFVLSWTPKLLIASGLSSSQGISGGIVLHLGGIIGQLTLGFLAIRYNLRRILIAYFALAVATMITFAFVMGDLQLALVVAWLNGFFVLGAITGSYAMTHSVYPTEIRTTALGWALGVGRIGAIASPAIAGLMLDLDNTLASPIFLVHSSC